jgi:UPF0716 protein FxsA
LLGRLMLLFVLMPLVELVLLLQIGALIGAWPTLALVVTTGVAGAALARSQGLRAFAAVQTRLAQGQLPGPELLDGLAVLVGGALLLTPGVLTDLVGFSLLVPWTRRGIRRWMTGRLERQIREGTVHVQVLHQDGIVDERVGEVGRWPRGGEASGYEA